MDNNSSSDDKGISSDNDDGQDPLEIDQQLQKLRVSDPGERKS